MMSHPGRLAGLVVVLGLTAGGCASHPAGASAVASKSSGAAPTPSVSPVEHRAPVQIVIAGVPTEKSPVYHFSVKSTDMTEDGVIDAPGKIAEYISSPQHFTNPSYTEVTTTLLTKDKSWLKIKDTPAGPDGLPRKWMSLDPKKMKLANGTPEVYTNESDPESADVLFENAGDVSRTSPGHFRGTINLSQTDGFLTAAHLKALGSKADSVTFTVVLDDQGRLTTTTMQIPAGGKFKANAYVITYDQYGTAAVPKLPTAAEQTKAPSVVYRLFS
jgi:hypothetical protein